MNGNKIDKERHECRQCFIIFSNERSMLRHNRTFHKEEYMQHLQKNNTVFLCYKCNQRFQTSAKLRQHNLSHGRDDKPFCCEICREGYSKFEELLKHRREVCPKRKFHCKVCGMNFQNLDSLETHKSIHLPRRRGRPAKKKETEWGTADEETVWPEKEDEEEGEDDEEEEEEELDGRVEDQRALGSPDMKTPGPDEEAQGRASESQQPGYNIPCSVDYCDLTFTSVEALRVHKQGNHRPQPATQSTTPGKNTIVPKEEEEAGEEVDDRSDAQRALRAHTSSSQGQASESQQPGYNIPCPVDNCELTFPSVEALRVHKQGNHRPQPATQSTTPGKNTIVPEEEQEADGRAEDQRALRAQPSSPQGSASKSQLPTKRSQLTMERGCQAKRMATVPGTADMKTALPKEEEEEEEVDDRSDAQRALRAHTSSSQGQASESQQPGYNIPCPVDICELTFPSVEALRVHKKDVHRPQPVPELALLHLP